MLSEKNIKALIEETVEETIRRLGLLTELSIPLKDYMRRVDGLRFQLVENWCLCSYCVRFGQDRNDFKHWVSELKAVISNLKLLTIKNGISKEKTLKRMLIRDYDYNSVRMITNIIRGKFGIEGITDEEEMTVVAEDFVREINRIIEVMTDESKTVENYLIERFLKKNKIRYVRDN